MNDRIQELAKQAELHPEWFIDNPELEQFAELIIRECAAVELYWLNEHDCKAVANKIQEHFGIKEQ
jgi:hypothetical protein